MYNRFMIFYVKYFLVVHTYFQKVFDLNTCFSYSIKIYYFLLSIFSRIRMMMLIIQVIRSKHNKRSTFHFKIYMTLMTFVINALINLRILCWNSIKHFVQDLFIEFNYIYGLPSSLFLGFKTISGCFCLWII